MKQMSEKLVAVRLFLEEQGYEPETPWNQRIALAPRLDTFITIEDGRDMIIAVWLSHGSSKREKGNSWHHRYDAHLAICIDLHKPDSFQRLSRLVETGLPEDGDDIIKDRYGQDAGMQYCP